MDRVSDVRVAWRCHHNENPARDKDDRPEFGCRPEFCPDGRPVLEWTYSRGVIPLPDRKWESDEPAEVVIHPEPEVRARPATADEIPRAAKKYAKREGVTVRYARGHAEVSSLVDAPERGEGKRKRETRLEVVESVVIRGDRWVAVWENGRTAGAFRWTSAGGWQKCAVAEI